VNPRKNVINIFYISAFVLGDFLTQGMEVKMMFFETLAKMKLIRTLENKIYTNPSNEKSFKEEKS
jgi:hypothetical protein